MTEDYIKLTFRLSRELYFGSLVWEECDNKLFLLVKPQIRFTEIAPNYGSKKDLGSVILEHLSDQLRYARMYSDSQEILNKVASICGSSETGVRDYISNKGAINQHIGDSLYRHLKPGVDAILNSGSEVKIQVHKKLYPRVKDRTRIPILIFDPERYSIDYINESYPYADIPSETVNSSKVRSVDDVDKFIRTELDKPEKLLRRIPLDRWLEATLPSSRYVAFPIDIRLY